MFAHITMLALAIAEIAVQFSGRKIGLKWA